MQPGVELGCLILQNDPVQEDPPSAGSRSLFGNGEMRFIRIPIIGIHTLHHLLRTEQPVWLDNRFAVVAEDGTQGGNARGWQSLLGAVGAVA